MHRKARTSGRGKKRRSRVLFIIAVLLTVSLVWVVIGIRFIIYPSVDSASDAGSVDAVYVLGPAPPERLAKGIGIVESGYSDHLVVTIGQHRPRPTFCSAQHSYTVHCVWPDPMTTEGEAQSWDQLADEHQWESVMVVTMRPHITRAELYFSRCFDGDVWMIDDERELSAQFWRRQFFYETAAFVKYLTSNDC